jgi:hypothetical protein
VTPLAQLINLGVARASSPRTLIAADLPAHTTLTHDTIELLFYQFHHSLLSIHPKSDTQQTVTMSAIAGDSSDGPVEVIKVLFALYPGYNTLDVAGPLEVLSRSLHDNKDKSTSFFSDSPSILLIPGTQLTHSFYSALC